MCIHIHTQEYYLALKKETLTSVTTWINVEDIMLNEVSQTNTAWYHFYVKSKTNQKKVELIEAE